MQKSTTTKSENKSRDPKNKQQKGPQSWHCQCSTHVDRGGSVSIKHDNGSINYFFKMLNEKNTFLLSRNFILEKEAKLQV